MEAITGLVMPLIVTAGVVSLYAVLRLVFRSEMVSNDMAAYPVAVLLTFAVAASLFYLGLALAGIMPGGYAFLATFAVHGLFAWIVQTLLPITADDAGGAQVSAERAPA